MQYEQFTACFTAVTQQDQSYIKTADCRDYWFATRKLANDTPCYRIV